MDIFSVNLISCKTSFLSRCIHYLYLTYAQDELDAAYCLTLTEDGTKIYAGYKQMIRVFDIDHPGKNCRSRSTYRKY